MTTLLSNCGFPRSRVMGFYVSCQYSGCRAECISGVVSGLTFEPASGTDSHTPTLCACLYLVCDRQLGQEEGAWTSWKLHKRGAGSKRTTMRSCYSLNTRGPAGLSGLPLQPRQIKSGACCRPAIYFKKLPAAPQEKACCTWQRGNPGSQRECVCREKKKLSDRAAAGRGQRRHGCCQ